MQGLAWIWKKWQHFGRGVGDFVGRLIMTVFYFTVALPFGLAVRLFSDPLRLKPAEPKWEIRSSDPQTLDDARRAY